MFWSRRGNLLCNLCLGGWAILKVPLHPGLVGHTLSVTCRVRVGTQLHEVILYKDGVEVMRQNGLNPHFYLTRLTLWDQGMYSCRASWDTDRRTHSVISAATPVQVLGEFIYWVAYAEIGCGCRSHVAYRIDTTLIQYFSILFVVTAS